jgi:hypothetical protein
VKAFTLFEVACLLHGLKPDQVLRDAYEEVRKHGGIAAEVLDTPHGPEMLYLNPSMFFIEPVGYTLERLKVACGAQFGVRITAEKARQMAQLVQVECPPEFLP